MEQKTELKTEQYLTFHLDQEVFAFDISKVREVLEYTQITKVPQTPEMMVGVIILRGGVVPVIDLRNKFGMGCFKKTVDSCIIITEITQDDENLQVGALVDSVSEVLDLDPAQIEPPPKIGTQINTDFIKGMGKINDQFVIILNIDLIFNSDELVLVQATLGENEAIEAAV